MNYNKIQNSPKVFYIVLEMYHRCIIEIWITIIQHNIYNLRFMAYLPSTPMPAVEILVKRVEITSSINFISAKEYESKSDEFSCSGIFT